MSDAKTESRPHLKCVARAGACDLVGLDDGHVVEVVARDLGAHVYTALKPALEQGCSQRSALLAIADHGYMSTSMASRAELSHVIDWFVDMARAGLAGDRLPELTDDEPDDEDD